MKNRNFKVNGKRFTIIESNATFSRGKWQAMVLDTNRDMLVKTAYYAKYQIGHHRREYWESKAKEVKKHREELKVSGKDKYIR